MTDLSLSHTGRPVAGNPSLLARIAVYWRHLRTRRKLQRLHDMSDRRLDDIGITRSELTWATELPLSVNAALALEDRAYRRRKAQRHMWL